MIPVEEIPHLMCALGYFPTQLEITNMTNEVKYSKFAETRALDLQLKSCPIAKTVFFSRSFIELNGYIPKI